MIRLRSLIDHTRNRIIDQHSLMTCLPTEDVKDLLEAAQEKLEREDAAESTEGKRK